ncbi:MULTISPECIES: WhiB family transcriptional regulator [Streptomycetaceae]|uniref:WhiB family transcriptional regulator n=1 Tax=Streptomycetaceae TaxID=2062 RepID=UPI000939DC10|nr:WhiB family transcriptional regulator [Streptomyces sp. CB02056]
MAVLHLSARPNSATHTSTATSSSTSGGTQAPWPCQTVDPELFYPLAQSASATSVTTGEQTALDHCATCPLARRSACLTEQLAHGPSGQWGVSGGLTAAQRRHLLHNNGKAGPAVAAQIRAQLQQTPTTNLPLAG